MSESFNLPDVGEGLTEADIVAWKVVPGDTVEVNQILVEIETAKSLVELPSPHAGTISQLHAAEGDTVAVGSPIVSFGQPQAAGDAEDSSTPGEEPAQVSSAAESGAESDSGATLVGYGAAAASGRRRAKKPVGAQAPTQTQTPTQAQAQTQTPAPAAPVQAAESTPTAAGGQQFALAKPPVRKYAKDRGVDLGSVSATGPRGDVTRADIDSFLAGTTPSPAGTEATGDHSAGPEPEEKIALKGVRKAMAQAMVQSAFSSPHVSVGLEVDMSATMAFVADLKASQALGEGVRVSPMLIAARALCWAALRHPLMNASLDGDEITVRKYVNLGVAAATDRGLIVPNVKHAHAMSLPELAVALQDLARTARSGKTKPEAQRGGTITLTNIGVFGMDWGTPIINPGESAIVAMGQVVQKPWVHDGAVVPRHITTLSVSADHRVVDGATISAFLADVAKCLREPLTLLL